ncbi:MULTISPECIES: helix-turn-helix domain-containing protein [Chryseobacterium]|jgi:excisionase family DNA binding protein|uniref:DNA-binding protein n=1 Tax=Chryseobacterium mucoviscidosis TaxID=1945581 RepID=A0A202BZT5_9FLAO|nr:MULTISPECIES: helix-turn-helix domain-containing protein [Chryseobacterium]OVE56980.1 DNA-binding protein [Chryseobacterium mucoviscidosis]
MQTVNPFQPIMDGLEELKELIYSIKKEPEIELKKKFYSFKEASEILKLDYQTVRSHVLKGNIKAEKIGRFYRINHLDLMNALNEVKSLKYKR